MHPRSLPRRLLAALLPALVVLAGIASSDGFLLCRMQGYTRACCCPHETARATPQSCPALAAPSCCDAVTSLVESLPPADQRDAQRSLLKSPQLAVAIPQAPCVIATSATSFVPRLLVLDATPRATTGPPLFIRHQALLI